MILLARRHSEIESSCAYPDLSSFAYISLQALHRNQTLRVLHQQSPVLKSNVLSLMYISLHASLLVKPISFQKLCVNRQKLYVQSEGQDWAIFFSLTSLYPFKCYGFIIQ